jgi:hypothetical protein
MSYGILTDNRTRYNKGVALYHETLKDYLKWGKGANAEGGRMIGECSETLRDIYHSQFGFGECCLVNLEQQQHMYGLLLSVPEQASWICGKYTGFCFAQCTVVATLDCWTARHLWGPAKQPVAC